MSKVVIVTGGSSNERAVSLRSGAAIAAALEAGGHQVQSIDLQEGLDAHQQVLAQADVVLPMVHGKGGEDGSLQAKLEARHLRYVGSDSKASALCFDKWQYKHHLLDAGLPCPAGEMVTRETWQQSPLSKRPFVLKPTDSGSSIDTFIVRDPAKAPTDAIEESFTRNPQMLLEELVEGTEMTVGVLGDEALPVIEIIPPTDGEFDYENKYNGKTQELCPPQHISDELQRQAQALALKAHQLTGCRDLSRTDIMVGPDDTLYILETNTLPGMTDQSLLPKAAEAHGYSMQQLVDRLVELALARPNA